MSDLSQAIDALADAVPHGHLLAATNGADLLHEAARLLGKREADLAVARAERDGLAKALDLFLDRPPGASYHDLVERARAALAALPKTPEEDA